MKNRFVLPAALAVLALAARADAAIQLDVTFLEQWFTVDASGPGQPGPDNSNLDTNTDLWFTNLFDTTGSTPGAASIQITGITINLDSSIYFDTVAGVPGFLAAFPFAPTGGTAIGVPAVVADGATTLTISFLNYGVGDDYDFSIDVDNSNAVVRGTNGSGGNHDMAGSGLVVNYTSYGVPLTATGTFGPATPASPNDTSTASVTLQTVPEPFSIAVWGVMGACGLIAYRRRR